MLLAQLKIANILVRCINLTVIINALCFIPLFLLLQNFYLWKKDRKSLKDMKDKDKELLIQVNKHMHTCKCVCVCKCASLK